MNGKQKNHISRLKNSISNVFSAFSSKVNNVNSLGTKQNKNKSCKKNMNVLGKNDSNKNLKSKTIIHRNNHSQSINFENSGLNNMEKVCKTFAQLNNNFANLIFNPITLGNEEKASLFRKENQKKIKKSLMKQKIKDNKINNNNQNSNCIKNTLNFHRCKSENDLKKVKIFSPPYYGYQIIFPSNIIKSQSNDFKKLNNINIKNKEEQSQKILSVKVVYYLEYVEKIILIQKYIRGFLIRKKRNILKSKINEFINHINIAKLKHSNISKKNFLKCLKTYDKNKLNNPLIKPILNKKITVLNFDKNDNHINSSLNIEENKRNNINKNKNKNNKDISQINNIFLGLNKKIFSPNITSSNSNLITKTFDTEFISSKISDRQLKIESVSDLKLISKNKTSNFSKYKELYMNALEEKEKLTEQLKTLHSLSQPIKSKNKVNNQNYIPEIKDYQINSKLNEISIINGNMTNNNEINDNSFNDIKNNNVGYNNNNDMNDNNLNSNQITNNPNNYSQSTYFFVDKKNSNSSPTVITINNTLSNNRNKKIFKNILPESQNINFKLESKNVNKQLSINKLSSVYIKPNTISSFKSLSIIKEKENNIKSKRNKIFNNLEINNNIFDILCKNNKNYKNLFFSEPVLNFSIIRNKKKVNFKLENLNDISISPLVKKYNLQIEQNKKFIIKNNENKKFNNLLENKIQSILYEPEKMKDNKIFKLIKENTFSIELKKSLIKQKDNNFEINTNEQINLIGLKKFKFPNYNNIIFSNNFELITGKMKKENIKEEVISFDIIKEKIKKDNQLIDEISFNIIQEKLKKEIKQEDVISFDIITKKKKYENQIASISLYIINEKIKKENQLIDEISFNIIKEKIQKEIKLDNVISFNIKKEIIGINSDEVYMKEKKNNEKETLINKEKKIENTLEKVISINIIKEEKDNDKKVNIFKKSKEGNIPEEVISFNIINQQIKKEINPEDEISFNRINAEQILLKNNKAKNTTINTQKIISFNIINEEKTKKEIKQEEIISFNIIQEETNKKVKKKENNKEENNEEENNENIEEKNKKKNINLKISDNLKLDFLPQKIEKQNKDNIINQITKTKWIELPKIITKYITNYNKSYIFHTLINHMKDIKKKNKINKNGKKLLKKFVNKKETNTKTNYFMKYKETIKIEKIIEKYLNQIKQIKTKNKQLTKENNLEKNNEENEEENNYQNHIIIKSSNFNFSTEKKSEENTLKFSNDLLIKSTNIQEEKKLKKGLLNMPTLQLNSRILQDYSKKIIPLKSIKINSARRRNTYNFTNKVNNPLCHSARIVLKKKPISFLTEYKNNIFENLFKIKENQNKKKSFSLWKNNTNLNQLFTFRPRESLNKNNLNIKKPKRQLRVKYIKKKGNNLSKDNSNSLSSNNSSKVYKQMKIVHKIFDGSGEITSINASRSSKLSETFTNVFDDLTVKDSLLLDRFINVNKICLKNQQFNYFNIWKNNITKLRRKSRKVASNKKNLVKYLLMMMIYNFTYLEPLKNSLDNRREYLLGKSLFIWYRHYFCFHQNNNID